MYPGGRRAVRDVDLTVGPGEVVGVIGESGSGKTSLALAAMGLLPAGTEVSAAALNVDGVDARALRPSEWRRLRGARAGLVFQEPMAALNPTMRVGQQVALALRNHAVVPPREIHAEAERLLRLVRLPDPERRARQYPHQLSGGQLQRVVIALALAARPRLLLADEPTTALDVTVQAEILELLAGIRDATGVGILFITHDLGVVGAVADRLYVMRDGVFVQEGPVDQVLYGEHHPYTASLLAALPGSAPPRTPLAAGQGTLV
ncbi:MAG: ABC transporter ATP-binding protein [Bifidobacteriaceae bacterium]|nr:ABC transporter ATP-binding protein [Bifidobacteriaceae bacterium]